MVVVVLLICLLISSFFFFNDTATTEIYTLSLHDALPISCEAAGRDRLDGVGHHLRSRPGATGDRRVGGHLDRKSTRLNSSHSQNSYAVFCLKKKKTSYMRLQTLVW